MKIIAITTETFWKGEAKAIISLLDNGYWRVHLRQPNSSMAVMEQLIQTIPDSYHHRLSLHDHFSLCQRYDIGGIHLNKRNGSLPSNFNGVVSHSCHRLEEINRCECYDYMFLSPIFDSISKKNYKSAFTQEELMVAFAQGLLPENVVALGGVTVDKLTLLEEMGFYGAALLGAAWTDFTMNNN